MKTNIYFLVLLGYILNLFTTACSKDPSGGIQLAVISTDSVTAITTNSAITGGNITSDGGSTITERGICYSTKPKPSIVDTKVVDSGKGLGAYVISLNGLISNTVYYVRAYSNNGKEISYGNEVNFKSLIPSFIVFQTGFGNARELWKIDPDGNNLFRLTNNNMADYVPAISPTGNKIVFARQGSLYTMNSDGTNPLIILPTGKDEASQPTWSPNGNQIAFTYYCNCPYVGNGDIYTISSTGSGFNRIVGLTLQDENHPSWSPDGFTIVYTNNSDLYRISATGGESKPIYVTPSIEETEPTLSPDGKMIAYCDGKDIFVVNSNGNGSPINLTNAPLVSAANLYPSWSPDGTMIAFASFGDIWTMNSNGSNKLNITKSPTNNATYPSWGRKP